MVSRPISEQTEQELIDDILQIYSHDHEACKRISKHIAEKLTQRRTLIREKRVAPTRRNR